ncbi:MAG TPA: leucyl aminopeptidase [Streptosporangiaceae bacterium]|nr:leucyl aminopeptidase [Streptosporangiaceae bacterium]
MPAIATVTPLVREDLRTAGDLLRAAAAGTGEPVDLVAVPVGTGGEIVADEALDGALTVPAREVIRSLQLAGKPGQLTQVPARAGQHVVRVAFLGVGDRSAPELRRAGAELGRALRPGESAVATAVTGADDDQVRAFAEGVMLGSYRYSEKSSDSVQDQGGQEQAGQVSVLLLMAPGAPAAATPATAVGGNEADRDGAIGQAAVVAAATALARDLANTPSVRKSPQWLADAASDAAAPAGLAVRVWNEQELAAAGFGGITAVGSGSERPPRLIELRYEPPSAQRHVVLVGKGITFDSGGLSLKPNDGMKAMKTDMAGGAVVIAVLSALARLGVTHQVTGLVAAAENMPSGSAYRPGDVITCFGGRTVEVLNTDAEGRLVLADAIAYADATLAPDAIIDIATLTGAARIALGGSRAALYATSDDLASGLIAAGEACGDRLWRMPLADDYRSALDSPVADLANVSRGSEGAGSVLAALFLREFAGSRPWAHLDVAGAARSSGDDGEISAGATGFGTRLLLRWLQVS